MIHLDEDSDDDDDDDDDKEYAMSKRQGGHNVVDQQSKCEIQCIYQERNPKVGKGKTVKEAAKVCKQKCPSPQKRRNNKKQLSPKKPSGKTFGLREFDENDEMERRELYNHLLAQLEDNSD